MMSNIKKFLPTVFTIGSAISCLVMVVFEVLYMHVPALAFLATGLMLSGYVITNRWQKRAE